MSGYLANRHYNEDEKMTTRPPPYLLVTALWYSMKVRPSKAMASVSPADFSWMAAEEGA